MFKAKVSSDRVIVGQYASMLRDVGNIQGKARVDAAKYGLECLEEANARGLVQKEHYDEAKLRFEAYVKEGEGCEEKTKTEAPAGTEKPKRAKKKTSKKKTTKKV